jgi:hypothetical protein
MARRDPRVERPIVRGTAASRQPRPWRQPTQGEMVGRISHRPMGDAATSTTSPRLEHDGPDPHLLGRFKFLKRATI